MFELTVRGDIASAHFIEGHQGKCRNLHGHTWRIDVTVASGGLNELGMVADFTVLKTALAEVLEPIDHVNLSEHEHFKDRIPTTETIAEYVYTRFKEAVKPLGVKEVRVWESDTSSVVYRE